MTSTSTRTDDLRAATEAESPVEFMRVRNAPDLAGPVVSRSACSITIVVPTTEDVTRIPEAFEPVPAPKLLDEAESLMLEAAVFHGFQCLDEHATTYIATPAQIVAVMAAARERGRKDALASTPSPPAGTGDVEGLDLKALHRANIERQAEWCPDQVPDLSFRGNELAGETGEACNVIKKLERERQGWRGSRATLTDLAEELADVVICADLCAVTAGIDLSAAVVAKFNATSEKQGLATKLVLQPTAPGGATGANGKHYPDVPAVDHLNYLRAFVESFAPNSEVQADGIRALQAVCSVLGTPEGLDREAVADDVRRAVADLIDGPAFHDPARIERQAKAYAKAGDILAPIIALCPTPTGDGDVVEAIGYVNVYRDADGEFVTGSSDLNDTADEAREWSAETFTDNYVGVYALVPADRAALAASKAQGGTETAKQQDPRRAIRFALAIDDHYDRREFLECWMHGDLSPWPEFAEGAECPKDEDEDDLPAAPPPATNVGV